ncbi:MAG TPA: hypothetical protein DCF48_05195 [Rikenellaceae bacterium]|nr:hypothetical protein [Rikenellaceae bacterium]
MKRWLLTLTAALPALTAVAQPHTELRPTETVFLYASKAEAKKCADAVIGHKRSFAGYEIQTSNGLLGEEILPEDGNLANITNLARIDLYFPEGGASEMVVICPGGAYIFVSSYNEGVYTAESLTRNGIAAAVVKYRLPNGHHEVPLEDVQNALRYCRSHAAMWGIQKLGIMGFSAGGHLAATASNLFTDAETRPDFSVLIYPVISLDDAITHKLSKESILGPRKDLKDSLSLETRITENTPPTFIALSADDSGVNPENSLRYFQALLRSGIPSQMYIYPTGGHGWGFTTNEYGSDAIASYREEFFTALYRFLKSQ